MNLDYNTPARETIITAKQKTWRPVVGGMFSLIIGTVNIYMSIIMAIIISSSIDSNTPQYTGWLAVIPIFLLGIATITGGLFSAGRKRWPLSLAGSICGLIFPVSSLVFLVIVRVLQTMLFLLPLLALGIAALWLTIISKPEFK